MKHRVRALLSYLRVYLRMALLIALGRPYKLTLLVAAGCNLRCQVCSIWQARNVTLSLEEVRRIFEAFPLKPCWINLSGGEPTLNRELEDILTYFVSSRRPLLITLTSNGYGDCARMIERVLSRNRQSVLYVSISLDGDAEQHDLARGRENSFARAERTLDRLRAIAARDARLSAGISTTLSRVNWTRLLPFIRAELARATPLSLNLAQASDYYRNDTRDGFSALPRKELANVLREVQGLLPKFSLGSLLKIQFLEGAIRYLEGRYTPLPCASIRHNVLIGPELDLLDCTLRFAPWTPRAAERSARLAPIIDVLRQPRERQRVLRERVRRAGCEHGCHTPCERFVHSVAALTNPRYAPRLLWTHLRVTLRSVWPKRAIAVAQPARRVRLPLVEDARWSRDA